MYRRLEPSVVILPWLGMLQVSLVFIIVIQIYDESLICLKIYWK